MIEDTFPTTIFDTICYFCHTKTVRDQGRNLCIECAEEHQLRIVCMSPDFNNKKLIYAHIFMDNPSGTGMFQIRLHLTENKTEIDALKSLFQHRELVIIIPGFPLNPANVKQKLSNLMAFL